MAVGTNPSDLMRGPSWFLALLLSVALYGCGQRPDGVPKAAASAQDDVDTPAEAQTRAPQTPARKPEPGATARADETDALAPASGTTEELGGQAPEMMEPKDGSSPPEPSRPALADSVSLEKQLAGLRIPPDWLEQVQTRYDTSRPFGEAREEIRRLLSLNTEAARKEAVKLTWIYFQKNDIGDGHQYPMYLFLGGEPLWAIRAHEEFLAKPHKEAPDHAFIALASLYTRYGEFEKAKATLDRAMAWLPAPPWRIAQQAKLHEAFGDLYIAWGKMEPAREHYADAIRLYPTSDQPYGQHLLKRQADRVQSKLDLLSVRSLAGSRLRDGRYTSTALGYAGDLEVTLTVRDGRMADIQLKHQEKIDQGACSVIPQRIIDKQSLHVDGVSGATVTKNAIIDGTLRCLRKAGLE